MRDERMKESVREIAAEFLAREANRTSLVTVTRVELTEDGRSGTIFMTVYPNSAEEQVVKFANRNRPEFSQFFEKRVRGRRAPRIEFAIDNGEKNRQRLDELTK